MIVSIYVFIIYLLSRSIYPISPPLGPFLDWVMLAAAIILAIKYGFGRKLPRGQ